MSSAVCLQLCCILLAVVVVSASPVAGPRGRRCGGLGHRTSRSTASDVQYAVVIDAGSSGSRVRVYKWPDNGRSGALMAGVESIKPTLKKEPGLADVADNETNVRNHIEQLIRNASGSIPPSHHDDTPIYFMATAGMRQLLEEKMNELVLFINSLMRDSTVNPFQYVSATSARILSGEEEGVFAWITVNYLLGSFAEDSQPTAGILEMGGASTQIAFVPNGNVLADKFPVRIGHVMYSLYVHSYLDYGQTAVIKNIMKRLESENPKASRIDNPCLMTGDETKRGSLNQTFVGTSDPTACLGLLQKLVYKADPSLCQPKPCAIGAFYQPTLPPNMDFYAVGGFIWTLRSIGALDQDGRYIPSVGFEKAFEYCQKSYSEALKNESASEHRFVSNRCLIGLYVPLLLTTGFGFANDSEHIYVLRKIAGQSPDWTLGAVMYENIEYGCWTMPSASASAERLHLVIFILAILSLSYTRMSTCLSS